MIAVMENKTRYVSRASRRHSAIAFETRMLGNIRVAQCCVITVKFTRVDFTSNHADVLDVVVAAADRFPQVQEVQRTADCLSVMF